MRSLRRFIEKGQIFIARVKLGGAHISFPKFQLTLGILWVFAVFGLAYGRFIQVQGSGQAISLMLSTASAVGALLIALLQNPWQRLKLFFIEILALIFLAIFVLAMYITYSLFFIVQ